MRPIKEGDIVTVCMARRGQVAVDAATVLDYSQVNRAKVLHSPVDTGDLWYFRVGELEFAVNPCSPDFVGLILEAGDDDCPHPCPGCEVILEAGRECPAIHDDA